jgi:hypothetical protein
MDKRDIGDHVNILMIGANYSAPHSSSGKILPTNFSWSQTDGDVVVYFDGSIKNVLISKKSVREKHLTFGWTSESPALISDAIDDLYNNVLEYKKYFNKIYTYSNKLLQLDPEFFQFCFAGSNLPWTPKKEIRINKKTRKASILCSGNTMTNGHKKRIEIAKQFIGRVDCYGDLFQHRIGGDGHYHHKPKTEALRDYMFSITIENAVFDTYFTEKITDCFANGVVPVYLGTRNVTNFFDADGIIFLDDSFQLESLTEELYVSKIKAIENNLQIVKNMTNADDYLFNNIINRLFKKDINK